MSGVASYNTKVKLSGTPVTMSSQAMSTNSTVANTYQVSSTARRILDRDTALTFYQNSGTTSVAAIADSDISSIDRLFGRVTFATTKAGTVSVSGKYTPVITVAGAKSYNINIQRSLLDDTDFSSTGWTSRASESLLDASGSISRWDDLSPLFFDLIDSGNAAIIEVTPGGQSYAVRGYFNISSDAKSGDVTSLESADLNIELDGDTTASFSFALL